MKTGKRQKIFIDCDFVPVVKIIMSAIWSKKKMKKACSRQNFSFTVMSLGSSHLSEWSSKAVRAL